MTTVRFEREGSFAPARQAIVSGIFNFGGPDLRSRLIGMYAILAVLNVGAWAWALIAFHDNPALLGMALLVYGLGLRHAVDADHIAAIDNVTRKLMAEGKRPVSVGFYFALGHSAVVVIVAAVVAGAATMLGTFQAFQDIGGIISGGASAVFLLALAAMNLVIFASVWRTYRRVRSGHPYVEGDLDALLNSRGFLTRILRPLFRLVGKSWHMFPLGFLFGLGFDTATEVAVFGLSATQAAGGAPLATILVFPVLFAAAMSLVDTTDGVVMLRAYSWASVEPLRKLRYDMGITLVSALIALMIGGIEAAALLGEHMAFFGDIWGWAGPLNETIKDLGPLIVGAFLAFWTISVLACWRSARRVSASATEAGSAGAF